MALAHAKLKRLKALEMQEATALFFEGGAELAYRWGVEWVRMTTVGRVEWSPGFGTERCKAELFT